MSAPTTPCPDCVDGFVDDEPCPRIRCIAGQIDDLPESVAKAYADTIKTMRPMAPMTMEQEAEQANVRG